MSQFPLIFIFILIIIGLTWGQWLYNKKLKKDQIIQIIALVSRLKTLIGLSQRHRGLNATLLQGNQSVTTDLETLRAKIADLISIIRTYPIISQEGRWDAYLDHWQRLEKSCATLTVPKSFEQHTILVETLLYLLEDVAERLELQDQTQSMVNYYYLWREFPHVVEYIGQARAIGVAVATKSVSTQVDKVKLGYLCDKISNLTASIFAKLRQHKINTRSEQIDQCSQICESLVQTINQSLIQQDIVTLDSKAYFELASETMDQCNLLLAQELEQIKGAYSGT